MCFVCLVQFVFWFCCRGFFFSASGYYSSQNRKPNICLPFFFFTEHLFNSKWFDQKESSSSGSRGPRDYEETLGKSVVWSALTCSCRALLSLSLVTGLWSCSRNSFRPSPCPLLWLMSLAKKRHDLKRAGGGAASHHIQLNTNWMNHALEKELLSTFWKTKSKLKVFSTSGRSCKWLWAIKVSLNADSLLFLSRFASHKLAVVQKPRDETTECWGASVNTQHYI